LYRLCVEVYKQGDLFVSVLLNRYIRLCHNNNEEISHLKGLSSTIDSDYNDETIQNDNINEVGKNISPPGLNDPQFPDVDLIPGGDLELENWMDL
jgi:hypothetical protein